MCGGAPAAPDYSAIAASNEQAAKYAKEAADNDLAFRQQVYADSQPRQQQLYDLASQVASAQLGQMSQTSQMAADQNTYYNQTYKPIEMQSALDSMGAANLSDEQVAQLAGYLSGGHTAGGTLAAPTMYDSSAYDALQARIRAAQSSSTESSSSSASSTEETPTKNVNFPSLEQWAIRFGDSGGSIAQYLQEMQQAQGGAAAGKPKTTSSTSTSSTNKTAGYQLTDEDKAILSQYSADKSAYDKARAAYDAEQQGLRTTGINALTRASTENAANTAVTQANAQSNSAYGQGLRALSRMGGDPNKLAAAAASLAGQQTLAGANAANNARTGAVNQGISLRAGTASFGRNMPNTAGQMYGLSTNAGNSSVANQNTGFTSALPYAQYASGGTGNQIAAAGQQIQGNLGLGGLMNQSYGAQLNYSAQQDNMLGGLAGAGLMYAARS